MYVVKKYYQKQDTLKGTKVVGEQYMLNVCLNSEKRKKKIHIRLILRRSELNE